MLDQLEGHINASNAKPDGVREIFPGRRPPSINVLGHLVICCAGNSPLGKVPKKARALLAFLATQMGEPVRRERLADLLWPYQGSEQARHSLRNCVCALHKALGPSKDTFLVADFADCRIHSDITIDLEDFERLSHSQDSGELQSAADLYRGEFLADLAIVSEPFEEWLTAERDRTRVMACDVLYRLGEHQAAAGDHEAAIKSATRLVMLDSFSEVGHRALMRAYRATGSRGNALRQYQICVKILKRDLGVTPDIETQSLAAEISRSNRQQTSTDPRPGAPNDLLVELRGTLERIVAARRVSLREIEAMLAKIKLELECSNDTAQLPNAAIIAARLQGMV